MSAATATALPACPRCQGDHLWNWLWQQRVDCPLLAALDATHDADARPLDGRDTFTRPATDAELELARALGRLQEAAPFRHLTDPVPPAQLGPTTTVRRSGGSVPHRTVAKIDFTTWSDPDDH